MIEIAFTAGFLAGLLIGWWLSTTRQEPKHE